MLRKLRESKAFQGTLLVSPTLIFMVGLLIVPLILTTIISLDIEIRMGCDLYFHAG